MRKIGRNDPCPCGSGKKYKKCCMISKTTEQLFDEIWKMCPCGSGKRYHKCCLGEREPGFAMNEKRYTFQKGTMQDVLGEEYEDDPRPNVIMLGEEDERSWYRCGVCIEEFSTEFSDFFPERCPLCGVKFMLGDGMSISDDKEFEAYGEKWIIEGDGCPLYIRRYADLKEQNQKTINKLSDDLHTTTVNDSTFVDITPYDKHGRIIINNKCTNCGEIIDISGPYIQGNCPHCGKSFNPNPFPFLDDG